MPPSVLSDWDFDPEFKQVSRAYHDGYRNPQAAASLILLKKEYEGRMTHRVTFSIGRRLPLTRGATAC
jgi:hypothetical protein